MKLKAGSNIDIEGNIESKGEPPFWRRFTGVAWLTITLCLIVALVIVLLTTENMEAASILSSLIGFSLGRFSTRFTRKPVD